MDSTNKNNWSVYIHIIPKEITNYENDKYYIGITSRKPKDRWSNGNGYKTQFFGRAIKKYGWENIQHIILKENLTHEQACNEEQTLIKKYKSSDRKYGYNITSGGDGTCGYKMSEDQIRKMSASMKGKYVGDKNPNYGNHKLAGKNNPQYGKCGELSPNYGKPLTDEHKKKISEAKKGHIVTKETREKLSSAIKELKLNNREVIQYDKNTNEIINVYESIADAGLKTNIECSNINRCCRGESKTAGGYVWRYKEDENNHLYDIKRASSKIKRVINNDTLQVFDNIISCAKFYGISRYLVSDICNNKRTHDKYSFSFYKTIF